MRHVSGKKIILAAVLLSSTTLAQADNVAGNSDAIQFGVQAGSIAGMTQSCGQDVSIFVARVNEALNKLAVSPTDRIQASATFQRVLQQTQMTETTKHTIPCFQVIQDYHSLPILRADYQQTVIAQLHPGMPSTPANTTPAQPAPAVAPAAAPAVTTPTAPAAAAPVSTVPPVTSVPPQPVNNTMNTMQPLPQSSGVPAVPNTATTPPPPATNYNQSALPGSQQQQMVQPSNTTGPAAPTATVPPANFNQNQNQQYQNQQPATLPPVVNGSPDE